MPTILFIVLTVVSQVSLTQGVRRHIIWKGQVGEYDNEIINEWATTMQDGDMLTSGKSYYKAILFTSKDALDRFLRGNHVDDGILIDVKRGTQSKIKQKRIEKIVTKESLELDHYEISME